MEADHRLQLWRLVVERAAEGRVTLGHVCAVMAAEAGVDGSAVTVLVEPARRETLYASDQTASDLAELTLTIGEWPSVDAVERGPVLVGDLATRESLGRWPIFAPAALSAGVHAVFALPMRVGGIRLGVIDLHRAHAGDLSRDQLRGALILANAAQLLLLDSAAVDGDADVGERSGLQHPEVHQATGMLIAQLGVSATVALARLRAYAYSRNRRLRDVAADVVARRLRLRPDHDRDQ
jgi:ANTAR domain